MKKTVEQKIVSAILDKGLADSTFRELYPKAYRELLHYRADLEADVKRMLKG